MLSALYMGIYIFMSSMEIGAIRYFVLFDDQMISMRYAKNLADGFGLVWNPGELPVEGYSNLLWVLIMSVVHLFNIPDNLVSLPVQFIGAVCHTLAIILAGKIAMIFSNGDRRVKILSMIFTAFYLPIITWALQGTETSLITVLLLFAIYILFSPGINNIKALLPAVILLGLRPDMITYYAIITVYAIIVSKNRRKDVSLWLSTGILVLILLLAFRFSYYGELFPNTYYLKMTGYPFVSRLLRGLAYSFKFILLFNPIIFLLPFFFYRKYRDRRQAGLLLTLPIVQIFYSIYVGGDAWEWWGGSNRFLSPAIPGFFIVLSVALNYYSEKIINFIQKFNHFQNNKKSSVYLAKLFIPALSLAVLLNVNMSDGPESLMDFIFARPTIHFQDNRNCIELALATNRMADNNTVVDIVNAGIIPYFCHARFHDMLGKNDKRIAKMEAVRNGCRIFMPESIPGHNKYDYHYSIKEISPDIILQFWHDRESAQEYLRDYSLIFLKGFPVYIKNNCGADDNLRKLNFKE